MSRVLQLAAAAVAASFIIVLVSGAIGLGGAGAKALGASTTLTIIAGSVDVRTEGSGFVPAADGDTLGAGTAIRTGPSSYAILTYFEGSTVSLDPSTEVVIETLEARPDGSTSLSLAQVVGRTWHLVQPLTHPLSKYEVTSPFATASVRGTAFEVLVAPDQKGEPVMTLGTSEGAVALASVSESGARSAEEVIVTAGLEAVVGQDRKVSPLRPAPPAERTLRVTHGSADGLVIDPVGRANGLKDGRLVLQTPGASARIENGELVVTIPDPSEGEVTSVEGDGRGSSSLPVRMQLLESGEIREVALATTGSVLEGAAARVGGGGVGIEPITVTAEQRVGRVPDPPAIARRAPAASPASAGAASQGRPDRGNAPARDPRIVPPTFVFPGLPTTTSAPTPPAPAVETPQPTKRATPRADKPTPTALPEAPVSDPRPKHTEAPSPETGASKVTGPIEKDVPVDAPKQDAPKQDAPEASQPKEIPAPAADERKEKSNAAPAEQRGPAVAEGDPAHANSAKSR